MTVTRSRRFTGFGLLSLAAQLVVAQAMAFAGPSPTPSGSSTAQSAIAGFAATASPLEINVGDPTTVTAEVSNSGDTDLRSTATFTVPYQLSVSSAPGGATVTGPTSGTRTVKVSGLVVAPGSTETLVLSLLGAHGTPARGADVKAKLTTGNTSLSSVMTFNVSGSGLSVTTSSDRKNAEVGERLNYSIQVASTGDQPVTDVFVTDHVPEELDTVWVELLEGISYRRVGSDLTWSIDSLAPGDSLRLRWRGRVATTGSDYVASNVVEASATSVPLVTAVATTNLLIPAGEPVEPPPGGGNGGSGNGGSGNGGSGSSGGSGSTGGGGPIGGSGSSDHSGSVGGSGTGSGSGGSSNGGVAPVAAPAVDAAIDGPMPFTGTAPDGSLLMAFALMAAGTLLLWGGRDRVVAAGVAFGFDGYPPSPFDGLSDLPWVALIPEGRGLWASVQELRIQASGGNAQISLGF